MKRLAVSVFCFSHNYSLQSLFKASQVSFLRSALQLPRSCGVMRHANNYIKSMLKSLPLLHEQKNRGKNIVRNVTNEVLRAEFGMCNKTVLIDNKERNNIGKIPSVIYPSYDLNFDNRKCLVCSLAIGWETFYDIRSKKRNISKLWSSLTLSNLVSYCDRQLYWQRTGHN